MASLDRITFNPNQCGGRPCIRGMRIRVRDVLDLLAAGVSERKSSTTTRTSTLRTSEPVWSLLPPRPTTRSCPSSGLERIARRRGHQTAIGAVARHLAEATYWILTKGEPYRGHATLTLLSSAVTPTRSVAMVDLGPLSWAAPGE